MDIAREMLNLLIACLSDEEIVKIVFQAKNPVLYDQFCACLKESEKTDAKQKLLVKRALAYLPTDPVGFRDKLEVYQNMLDIKDAQIYKTINMSRQRWSQLKNRVAEAGTSHENYLKICIVLKLDYFEALDLLASAGVTFSADPVDKVIASCLMRGIHDPSKVDEELYRYHLPMLFSEE